jgi:hypothetical protein
LDALAASGVALRYLGSSFVPEEESCFCRFESDSAPAPRNGECFRRDRVSAPPHPVLLFSIRPKRRRMFWTGPAPRFWPEPATHQRADAREARSLRRTELPVRGQPLAES